MNFLHGFETVELEKGSRPISVVKSAVIGLVGIAPEGETNVPKLVMSERDAAQFGSPVPGFNIPQALSHIFAQGAGTVVVVNVFDPALHTTQVTDEVGVIAAGKVKLANYPIGAITIKDNVGAAVAFVEGEDYVWNKYGELTVLNGAIADATSLKFSYKKLNAAAITDAVLIGETDVAGNKTGIKAFDLAANLFGFTTKILIAPGYSSSATVATELLASADRNRAKAVLDATYGQTVTQAIAGRAAGSGSNFATSSKRALLCYPYLKALEVATGEIVDYPYSSFLAGVIAATDNASGYWNSPSNKEIKGIVGVERNITAGISDANSEANLLNEKGIITVFNSFGTGYRTWGNRSAAYPINTAPDNFISVRRNADVILESVQQAALQFVDKPITKALIDDIRETVNGFINTLIGRGALIPGSQLKYNVADNTPEELAAGHITFELVYMGPTPAERITLKSVLDISLLQAIK